MPRIAVVIGAAIVLQRVTRGVVGVIKDEWHRLFRVRRFQHLAELPGYPFRTDHLEIGRTPGPRAAAREIGCRAPTDHVLIDFADDRVDRDRRVIGVPARAEQTGFFTGVTDEQDRATRPQVPARAGERFGDFENCDRAGAVVVGAVADGVGARPPYGAQAVQNRPDAGLLCAAGGARRAGGAPLPHDAGGPRAR